MPAEKSYAADDLDNVNISYGDYLSRGASTHDPGMERLDGEHGIGDGIGTVPDGIGKGYVPRSFEIGAAEVSKYGATENCPGCVWQQHRLGPRRNHSEECRNRFQEAMANDVEDQDKVKRAKARAEGWNEDSENDDKRAGEDPRQGQNEDVDKDAMEDALDRDDDGAKGADTDAEDAGLE